VAFVPVYCSRYWHLTKLRDCVFAFIVKRFRAFRAPLQEVLNHSLIRFETAQSWNPGKGNLDHPGKGNNGSNWPSTNPNPTPGGAGAPGKGKGKNK
ncbi:hypothetical protein ACO1DI_24335, partial [Priestia sp. 40]|uniref:hypothetical protein n=1 Tax=Priestia sp. 40 TaxID=3394459 RepID=UPI003BF733A9